MKTKLILPVLALTFLSLSSFADMGAVGNTSGSGAITTTPAGAVNSGAPVNSANPNAATTTSDSGAYNSGSTQGAWIDLDEHSDKDSFYAACKTLHADEADPELMFQDWEDLPRHMVSECSIDDELWEWLELDEDDRELWEMYLENVDQSGTFEQAQMAFSGKFDSPECWAESYLEDCGVLQSVPNMVRFYIDFSAYARDAQLGGDMTFCSREGYTWAFSNHC